MYWFGGLFVMSKDDMETATLNVMFDGSEEIDDDDDEEFKVNARTEKMVEYFEDDYYWQLYNRRNSTGR